MALQSKSKWITKYNKYNKPYIEFNNHEYQRVTVDYIIDNDNNIDKDSMLNEFKYFLNLI